MHEARARAKMGVILPWGLNFNAQATGILDACRYNLERLSNGLQRVRRLQNLREPIKEGYFPKLDSLVSSRAWPSRAANTVLSVSVPFGCRLSVSLENKEI